MKNIAVIGAGTMGNGIAHVFAQNGFDVHLFDISSQALERAVQTISKNLDRIISKGGLDENQKQVILNRLKCSTELKVAVEKADLVVEAATERVDLKLNIFSDLSRLTRPGAILASNTSSISITRIGAATNDPSRVIGMHFMNPVPVMKLVEIIRGYSTSEEVVQQIVELSRQLQKIPVEVGDFPGFISNRILMTMINEAIESLHEGVAGVKEIDAIMKLGMAHPMGPLQLADFIGLDVCLAILRVLQEGFGNPKYAPCPLLVNMVTAGKLGVKTGEGFYRHDPGSKDVAVSAQFLSRSSKSFD
ncbi:MAG: 3-hydroxybutyryl-CoA dehydrogenase [Saprospiraceae bacterium]|jgi:3-hydroxybutyryl-CoA dehydrogenase|nr:3-hydroxybutyryl-CoA dehydrogenase [Saprospiraceae bacterium]MBP9208903.1 3-hydroxybutyryl-CoA dehydrogenase [Saprospiraceae bacterium]MBV6472087.1 putative 3-hydroxybutyryl-CoA dehydrogenase [Saprospiraceae bacterium]